MKHEGFRDCVYTDTTGHLTIGYGHNLEARPISQNAGSLILDDDMLWFLQKLDHHLDFFRDLDDARKSVLVDMAYNLGLNGLLQFDKMLNALREKDYSKAADEMLNSKWAIEVGERAEDNAYIIRTGEL